jgi:hypothetical protein
LDKQFKIENIGWKHSKTAWIKKSHYAAECNANLIITVSIGMIYRPTYLALSYTIAFTKAFLRGS